MIQQQTILRVSDNSGAKTVRCLKILKGFKKKYGKLGDIIIVSVLDLRNKSKKISKVKKKEIYQALILKTNFKYTNRVGFKKNFNENTVVLINKQGTPVGTRILGFIPKVLKKKKFQKFISISMGLF